MNKNIFLLCIAYYVSYLYFRFAEVDPEEKKKERLDKFFKTETVLGFI